jgi:hypothetical protein
MIMRWCLGPHCDAQHTAEKNPLRIAVALAVIGNPSRALIRRDERGR